MSKTKEERWAFQKEYSTKQLYWKAEWQLHAFPTIIFWNSIYMKSYSIWNHQPLIFIATLVEMGPNSEDCLFFNVCLLYNLTFILVRTQGLTCPSYAYCLVLLIIVILILSIQKTLLFSERLILVRCHLFLHTWSKKLKLCVWLFCHSCLMFHNNRKCNTSYLEHKMKPC